MPRIRAQDHLPIGNQIGTGLRRKWHYLAVDNCLEVVTVLHFEGRIYASNITVECILWNGQQARAPDERSIFELRRSLLQDKSIRVIVCTGACRRAYIAEPLRRTGIHNKVIGCPCQRGRPHNDGHPERTVRCGCRPEDLTLIVPNLPVAAIAALN